jgi:hypothetical protein
MPAFTGDFSMIAPETGSFGSRVRRIDSPYSGCPVACDHGSARGPIGILSEPIAGKGAGRPDGADAPVLDGKPA